MIARRKAAGRGYGPAAGGIAQRGGLSEMENRMHRLISCALVLLSAGSFAEDLPAPEELLKDMGVSGQYVTVVEPHQSGTSRQTHITYLAVLANKVLDRLFGHDWQSPDNDVVFFATDGYQFAANADRFMHYRAYLAYARADGKPFTLVDNKGQRTELGPYYLIWDNIDEPSLIRQGAYGWPYEVTQVRLRPVSAYAPLLPERASRQAREGFALVKEYCLTCHRVAGIGGEKLPADLRPFLCSLNDSELEALIDNPNDATQKGGMPPLDPQLQGAGRRQTIELIVAYLRVLRPEGQSCQAESARPASDK
jgi:mono/diheme cytochrome c family protein